GDGDGDGGDVGVGESESDRMVVGAGDEEGEVGQEVGVIEGLEALRLVGGEEFTAKGFVWYALPLWGSVVDDPLDDDSVGEGGFVGDLMDQNSVVGESEGESGFKESITEEGNIKQDEDAASGQGSDSSETFNVKDPTGQVNGGPDQFFTDGFEGFTEDVSQCGGIEDRDDDAEDSERDERNDEMEVCPTSDSRAESEDKDGSQTSYTSGAAADIDTDDEMEIDPAVDSDTQIEEGGEEDYDSESHQDTPTDDAMSTRISDEMDIWADIDQSPESVASEEEGYDFEETQDTRTDDGMDTSELVGPSEEVFEDTNGEDFDFEHHQQIQSHDWMSLHDGIYQDSDIVESGEEDSDSADHQPSQTDEGTEIWEDIYRDPDSEIDDGELDRSGSPGLTTDTQLDFDQPNPTEAARQESTEPDADDEGDKYVQNGYGAQFQGERVWQGDESDESEEE
ncbi:hypothetical protein IFR05_014390, partial [Cadophora sp. M221]